VSRRDRQQVGRPVRIEQLGANRDAPRLDAIKSVASHVMILGMEPSQSSSKNRRKHRFRRFRE
jgi:hypothetical protein